MKRTLILIFLLINAISALITAASYCYVSGNTFTIPSGNKENNPYHTYNIDGKEDKNQNRKIKISKKTSARILIQIIIQSLNTVIVIQISIRIKVQIIRKKIIILKIQIKILFPLINHIKKTLIKPEKKHPQKNL